MSRWIEEEWLLDYFADDIDYYGKYVREDIKDNMPTIEIIRCRECKAYDSECEWCGGLGLEMKPDDFCSYAEREGE